MAATINAYRVDRSRPGCVIFMLDQSYSMNKGIAGSQRTKIEALSTAINRFIGDLIIRCTKEKEEPWHYFDIGLIGYTTTQTDPPQDIIGSVLQGDLASSGIGREIVSIVELYNSPLAIEDREKVQFQDDGAGGTVPVKVPIKFPVWYRQPDPNQMGGTPMLAALNHVKAVAEAWCAAHPRSMPPIVLNMTDGESTDGEPEEAAATLKGLSTSVGNLLLFNCHLSDSTDDPITFPTEEGQLHDQYAKLLFRMSSELPTEMRATAEEKGIELGPGARGMVFNADSAKVALLIQVGTLANAGADKIIAMEMGGPKPSLATPAAAPAPEEVEPEEVIPAEWTD
jgi:hypothetical protein